MATDPDTGARQGGHAVHADGWLHRLIDVSLAHRGWVLAIVTVLTLIAGWRTAHLKLDALPDLSDTQVIVKAEWPGQPPRLVEDQVTYPLTASLLGVPGATSVRGFSMFGESFVYVVFGDDVDPYWARSRVSERLSQLSGRLPDTARASLGPEASGTGWVFQYALVSRDASLPTDRLRALQETQLRQVLQSVPGVAEVATFGGAARQLQIEIDTARLQSLGVTMDQIASGVREANRAGGGAAVEMGRQRFFIATDARLRGAPDLLDTPVGTDASGLPIRLRQVARVSTGPTPREGVGDLDGQGDAVGGIVVMRQGEHAAETLRHVRQRLDEIKSSLPRGVELVTTYDRGRLIGDAVRSLSLRLVEEGAVVALVCGIFLWRWRSALVAIVSLPVGLLVALALLERQGITANIMSLGGLAIAIGAMIDAAVVMVETLHRKLETRVAADRAAHWALVREAAREVGPALFFSLLVVTVSFLPVFSLQGQEGKLFAPLALTKTYAMAAAAGLSVSLVPVLMGLFIRGPLPREHRNPVNRVLKRLYRPVLKAALDRPRVTIAAAVIVSLSLAWPMARLGSEFMPPLDEGDLLYMPTTLPSVSADEAADILRRTSAVIRQQPEVARVHGKAGRSDSATDPAPLSMIETTVELKPRAQWPDPSLSREALIERLDEQLRWPGLTGSWGHPIRTRIDMLSTGVKTPLALRIAGPDTARIEQLTEQAESVLRGVAGVRGVFAERTGGGRFIDVRIDRAAVALHGLRIAEIADVLGGPVAGMPIDTIIDGRERYPVVLRVDAQQRDGVSGLSSLRLGTPGGGSVSLGQLATFALVNGPSEIKSENARPVGYVLLDLADADIGGVLERARAALAESGVQAEGYTLDFVGQYLRLQQAALRLAAIGAATLGLVALILFAHFRDWTRVGIVLAGLPGAAAGGLWLCLALGQQWSFATVVGLLALAGVAAEFCVVMLLYLDQERARDPSQPARRFIVRGALLRLRPKSMTVAVILAGLVPLLVSDGVGVDVMRRVAAPMIGGMLVAPFYSLLVVPAIYRLMLARSRTPIAAVQTGEQHG